MKTIKSVLKTRRQGTRLIAAVFLLLAVSLQAAVITNITQLDSAAVFHFAIMSDNKGDSPSNSSHMQRCDTWVKNSGGIASAFVIGLGDHTVSTSSTNDPILRFIRNDSYWKTKFYPGIADGENQSFGGSQGAWGKGYHLFEYVDNFFGRSNVTFRPLTSDPDDRQVDYYAKVTVSGYNVHILNLHFADQYDGRMGGSNPFVEATQAYMQSKLEALAAAGKTDHDIIIVLAHSTGGDFVEQGNINSTRKDLLLCTADLCVSATTHRYGWWDRYKTYDNGNGAVSYNSGSVGHAGGHPDKPAEDGVQGYMELHVLENPPRMTIQYIKTELSSRTLHVGKYSDFNSYDSAKYGTPVIKQINGPWGVVDWNNLPLGTTGTNGASYVSQTVPTNMVAGTVSNVTVKMKNTGTSTWSPAEAQKLGSLGDSNTWGVTRVYLTGSVAPNQTNTFTFNITAPATAGNYSFQWRMVDDEGSNLGWFGATSLLRTITVTAGSTATTSTFYSVGVHDGYVDESSETSNVGGTNVATSTSGTALRVGDTGARRQRKSIVSFDTSALPDMAVITAATLKLKRGGGIGTPTTLSNLVADVKNAAAGFGTSLNLENADFEASATANAVVTLNYPATTNAWSTGNLNSSGLSAINKTGHTQFRVRFTADDDNDTADDYLGFYSGENASTTNKPVLVVVYQ